MRIEIEDNPLLLIQWESSGNSYIWNNRGYYRIQEKKFKKVPISMDFLEQISTLYSKEWSLENHAGSNFNYISCNQQDIEQLCT